jgi:hypothetical protein
MSVCAKCGLAVCACRSGRTRVSVGAGSIEEGKAMAEAYLGRLGYTGDLLAVRRRRTRLGIMGYQAWDLTYTVTRHA